MEYNNTELSNDELNSCLDLLSELRLPDDPHYVSPSDMMIVDTMLQREGLFDELLFLLRSASLQPSDYKYLN